MLNKQKGFTLIELLVVVAIIGILASVVLASLGKARNKAKDAAIMSELSNLRAFAEMNASDNNGSYQNVCSQGGIGAANQIEINGVTVDYCYSDESTWVAYKDLIAPGANYVGYCVDYMGTAKKVTTEVNSGDICPE